MPREARSDPVFRDGRGSEPSGVLAGANLRYALAAAAKLGRTRSSATGVGLSRVAGANLRYAFAAAAEPASQLNKEPCGGTTDAAWSGTLEGSTARFSTKL